MINNPTLKKLLAGIVLMAITLTSQAQGLFDDIIKNVNKGDERKALVEDIFTKTFNTHAKSIFKVETGKPVSRQATNTGDEKINVQVPFVIRFDDKAYATFCNDLRKHLENPQGLNLKPIQISIPLTPHAPQSPYGSYRAEITTIIQNKIPQQQVFGVLGPINTKEIVLLAYPIDQATFLGIQQVLKMGTSKEGFTQLGNMTAAFCPDHINIDLINDKNEIIVTRKKGGATHGNEEYNHVAPFDAQHSLSLLFNIAFESGYSLTLIAPGCCKPGYSFATRQLNEDIKSYMDRTNQIKKGYLQITKQFPIVEDGDANFHLPIETLNKIKSIRSTINYKSLPVPQDNN